MTTNVVKMYRAVRLTENQWELHRFRWREDCTQPIGDYRMTRVTFSRYVCITFLGQHGFETKRFGLSAEVFQSCKCRFRSLYVDDGLVGEDLLVRAIHL